MIIVFIIGISVVGSTNAYAVYLWTVQTSGTPQNLYSVHTFDTNNAITVGGAGTILKTTNGGIT